MLRELRIKNLAVIESVTVSFTAGLNVLTGETGAGKSIVIDALLLVGGARAAPDLIRADADAATVEAVFSLDGHAGASAVLDAAGLAGDDSGDVVVRRELSRAGRHRAFVNDSPVTAGLLERLGEQLVEVHGQHEHQRLQAPGRQLEVLDRFADAESMQEGVATLFAKYRAARADLERLRAAERDRAQREDLLHFQVGELDGARLRVGEEAELRIGLKRLQHAERFGAGLAEVQRLLDDDPASVTAGLARAMRLLHDLGRLDPAFSTPAETLDTARIHVEDALAALRALRDSARFEPGRLEAIDDRLHALARLRRKYGDSEEAMLQFRADAAAELERLARHDELVAGQERTLVDLHAELASAAQALSERRRAAAGRLAAQAERQMRALGMERAIFQVAVTPAPIEEVTARGLDAVEFGLSTNPGEAVKPLGRVASGGELSRTMLALEAVLARADRIPTLVFDEVDAGIGGRVASVVGGTLAAAAEGRQVLCVTHLAAIAARAEHHVRVVKSVKGGRTRVGADAVEGDARVLEVARMLGGDASSTALDHARTLLGARRRGKARAV
jgi:DNA repair protein RecN (Recombination protein N)